MDEIYRERGPGAAAKRQELLRRRRDELVTMPHAVRRVVVARSARIAGSMVAALAGVAMIAAAASTALADRVAWALPGLQPAPVATLLFGAWLLGLVAWAITRARVEHRFAVAMSRYVLPSTDLDLDVERLDHERPDTIARAMGHQLEVRSAVWPIVAAAVVVPASLVWLGWMVRAPVWPVSDFEATLAGHAGALALTGMVGALAAIGATWAALRQPTVATVAWPVGLGVTAVAIVGLAVGVDAGWPVAGLGMVTAVVGLIGRTLQRERALLEVEDPAAGSELFTIRDAVRALRTALTCVHGLVRRVSPRTWGLTAATASVALLGGGALLWLARRPAAPPIAPVVMTQAAVAVTAHDPVAPTPPTPSTPEPGPAGPAYAIERVGARLAVVVEPTDRAELVVALPGVATVPQGWTATLLLERGSGGSIAVIGADGAQALGDRARRIALRIDGCGGPQPLELHLRPDPGQRDRVTLYVTPQLATADCPPATD